MRSFLILPAVAILALGACQQQGAAAPKSTADQPILASDLLLRSTTPELDFRWSVPPEAAVEPVLFRALRADAETQLKQAETEAKSSAAEAKEGKYPFYGNQLRMIWSAEAETPALLALSAQIYSFTGGAHGNAGFTSALFDRSAGQKITFADLFAQPDAALQALTPGWCKGLDEARAEKRQGTVLEGFSDCPALKDQTIVPVGEGTINTLKVLVAPYVAGPWAEGSYEVNLPTTAILPLLKTAYAKDFAQP